MNFSNNIIELWNSPARKWSELVNITENEAKNCIYNQIEHMVLDDLNWSNDFIYADHEDTDRFMLTENNFSFAKGMEELRDSTHVVFDEFEYGMRWKILPVGVEQFGSFDGCFTLQYRIPKDMYLWSSPYIHPFDIDDQHTLWF